MTPTPRAGRSCRFTSSRSQRSKRTVYERRNTAGAGRSHRHPLNRCKYMHNQWRGGRQAGNRTGRCHPLPRRRPCTYNQWWGWRVLADHIPSPAPPLPLSPFRASPRFAMHGFWESFLPLPQKKNDEPLTRALIGFYSGRGVFFFFVGDVL
ncbi:hypothetical protein GDO81_026433 [Engystomops pustulosus]|uniref:Uncharacterized protein n=1 Tax=Engystomops pustulosus TaxID=76066 RepID=A0AAV6YMA2_ENGPU|nr:hypothetical protein GDO81_026433 [Engystomops pustulosus]